MYTSSFGRNRPPLFTAVTQRFVNIWRLSSALHPHTCWIGTARTTLCMYVWEPLDILAPRALGTKPAEYLRALCSSGVSSVVGMSELCVEELLLKWDFNSQLCQTLSQIHKQWVGFLNPNISNEHAPHLHVRRPNGVKISPHLLLPLENLARDDEDSTIPFSLFTILQLKAWSDVSPLSKSIAAQSSQPRLCSCWRNREISCSARVEASNSRTNISLLITAPLSLACLFSHTASWRTHAAQRSWLVSISCAYKFMRWYTEKRNADDSRVRLRFQSLFRFYYLWYYTLCTEKYHSSVVLSLVPFASIVTSACGTRDNTGNRLVIFPSTKCIIRVYIYVTVSRKRMRFAQNLECEFYISADSVKRAL